MNGVEELLARWVVEDLPPEEVPDLAVEALQDGCDAPEVVVLAGLNRPTRTEVNDELPALLRRLGVDLPCQRDAFVQVANRYIRLIAEESIAPVDGGRRIWSLANRYWDERGIVEQLTTFIGLVSEWDDHPEYRTGIETDIVSFSRRLHDLGGAHVL